MSVSIREKMPIWYWGSGALGFLWFLMSAIAFILLLEIVSTLSDEVRVAAKDMHGVVALAPEFLIVYGFAAFGGASGCFGLITKKKWAPKVFIVALIAVSVQQISLMVSVGETPFGSNIEQVIPIVITAFLLVLAQSATQKGWLV